jgi:hypothetical protein
LAKAAERRQEYSTASCQLFREFADKSLLRRSNTAAIGVPSGCCVAEIERAG